jgi:tRNA threonylcarbamoyladenosine biosynthesis protein TsaB
MLVASVDSATLTLSCALLEVTSGGTRLLCDRTDRAPAKPPPGGPAGGHSVRLPGALADLLRAEGRKVPDVEGYAVGLGPGSFTGLRIGLATWKGLAYANRRPIAGASSLAAMALGAAGSAPEGALLVPLLDARKGEVYAGFYREGGSGFAAAAPEAALAPEALAARLATLEPRRELRLGFGEGFLAYRERLAGAVAHLEAGPATPSAEMVARLVASRLAQQPFDSSTLFALEPHYVRLSEAEIKFPHGLPVRKNGTS